MIEKNLKVLVKSVSENRKPIRNWVYYSNMIKVLNKIADKELVT